MGVKNKVFTENISGNKVKIIDEYSDIAITESKDKIHVSRLLDPRYYTEVVDPTTFFKEENVYNVFAEKIKGIDTSNLPDDNPGGRVIDARVNPEFAPSTNESAVIIDDSYDERAELAAKYGAIDPLRDVQRQSEAFDKILNPEPPKPRERTQPQNGGTTSQDPVYVEPSQIYTPEDPMIVMFKNTKRIVDFDVSLKINNKIPRLDFIEMMEDSYDTSIIEFLADEFTEKILKDPSFIRELIVKEIKGKVYPNGVPEEQEPEVKTAEVVFVQSATPSLMEIAGKSAPHLPTIATYPDLDLEPVIEKKEKEVKTKRPKITPDYIDKPSEIIVEKVEAEKVEAEKVEAERES